MKLIAYLVPLSAAALLVAGCAPRKQPKPSVDTQENATFAAANEGSLASPESVKVGGSALRALPVIGPAPAWKLKDVNGNEVSSDTFKGKVVVLDFWATWCPPCREEIPGYVELSKKYGDKLAIIGVSVDEGGPAVVKPFLQKFGVSYPVVMADDKVVAAYGGVEAIPTTFLIDRDGQIRDKKVGSEPTDHYEKKIHSLVR